MRGRGGAQALLEELLLPLGRLEIEGFRREVRQKGDALQAAHQAFDFRSKSDVGFGFAGFVGFGDALRVPAEGAVGIAVGVRVAGDGFVELGLWCASP